MIHIGTPYITEDKGRAYLKAKITIPEETALKYTEAIAPVREMTVWLTDEDYPPAAWKEDGTLWFDVPAEYGKYLCKERSNAFVIDLFWYAMVTGSDIEFEAPLSKRLYDGLTEMLMPALEKNGFPGIALKGPVTSEPVWCEGAVVTGMSCGVDSNYTLLCYSRKEIPKDKKLTHLAIYTDAYLFRPRDVYKGVETLYSEADAFTDIIIGRAEKVAKTHGLPLIVTNTNVDKDFYRGGYTLSGMYRHLACTLAMEHLYRTYISSSSGHENGMVEVSLFLPTQLYEDLLCSSLRTETFFYCSSDNVSRVDKLRALADDPVFQKTVSVCFDKEKNGKNCGVCFGCMKTMMPLDLLGKLDGFGERFDLDAYYREREERFRFLIDFSKRPEAESARQTVRQMAELAEKEKSEAGDLFLRLCDSQLET